jgi:hypothetical protein
LKSVNVKTKLSKQQYKKQQAYLLNWKNSKLNNAHQHHLPGSHVFNSPNPLYIDTNFSGSFQAAEEASNCTLFSSPSSSVEKQVNDQHEQLTSPLNQSSLRHRSLMTNESPPALPSLFFSSQSVESESLGLIKNVYPSIEMIDYPSK